MINKFLRGLKLISYRRKFLRYLLSPAGSITSLELVLSVKSHCDIFKTIIDVGANIGQFALASSYIYPEAKIYSFEALPSLNSTLSKNLKQLRRCKIYNLALNSTSQDIQFYECDNSQVSSALKPLANNSRLNEIVVHSDRLDNILKTSEIERPSLLKLDVQGFEKEVLKGATGLFNVIDYVLMEVSLIHAYQNEPLFNEMNEFMSLNNFSLIAPVHFLTNNDYSISQIDALFIRK